MVDRSEEDQNREQVSAGSTCCKFQESRDVGADAVPGEAGAELS